MSKFSLLLLPGLMCDETIWQEQRGPLETVSEVSVPDYGELDSISAMAEHVLAHAPATFHIAGHSMGGRVALEVARRAPERVRALALLDTGYQGRPEDAAGEREAEKRYALLEIARTQGMPTMAREWVQGMVHPQRLQDAALIDAIVAMIARNTPARFHCQIRALLARPDAEYVLRGLQCPALILCGRDDAWSPLARHEDMAALVPQSKLTAIPDCGHMSTMEQPQAIAEALLDWLRSTA